MELLTDFLSLGRGSVNYQLLNHEICIWLSDDAGAQVAIIYSMWSLDVLGQVMY